MANPVTRNKGRPRKPLIMSHVEPGVAIPRSPWEDLDIGNESLRASATALSAAAAAAAAASSLGARLTRSGRSSRAGPRLPVRSLTALRSHDGDAGAGPGPGPCAPAPAPATPTTPTATPTATGTAPVPVRPLTADVLQEAHRGRASADVQVLRLAGRGLTDPEDSPALFRPYSRARCLDAENNHLTLGGVRGFPELHTLSLAGNRLHCAEVHGGLGRWFPALRLLDLSLNALPAAQLSVLGALPELAELRLSANGLTTLPRDLAAPGNFPQLRVLLLDRNRLRDHADLRTLSRLPLLQRLALDYNPRLRALPCLLRERPVDAVDSMEFPPLQKKPSSRQTPRSQQTRRRHRQTSLRKPRTPEPPVLEVSHAPFPRLEHVSLRGTALTRDADAAGALCWPRLRVLELGDTPLARSSSSAPALGPVLARLFCLGVNVHRDPATTCGAAHAFGPRFHRLRCEDVTEGGWRLPRRDSAELQTLLESLVHEKEYRKAHPERDLQRSRGPHPPPHARRGAARAPTLPPASAAAAAAAAAVAAVGGEWGGGGHGGVRSRSCSAHRKGSSGGGGGGGSGQGWNHCNSNSNSHSDSNSNNNSNTNSSSGVGSGGGSGLSQPSEVSSRDSCCSDPGVRAVCRKAPARSRRRAGVSASAAAAAASPRGAPSERRGGVGVGVDQLQLLFQRSHLDTRSSQQLCGDWCLEKRKPDVE